MLTMKDLREFVAQNTHVHDDTVLLVAESEPSGDFDNSGVPVTRIAHDHSGLDDPGDLGLVYVLAKGVEYGPATPNNMIQAEVHSDDHVYGVDFNATPWFDQASDEEIESLLNCDFGGDYPADEVARHFDGQNQEITILLDYCRRKDGIGFECHVDVDDVGKWLAENRPNLYQKHQDYFE